jgi:SAM-dependent methyltransferase
MPPCRHSSKLYGLGSKGGALAFGNGFELQFAIRHDSKRFSINRFMLTPDELQHYKREYNLAGQPDFLMEMNQRCSLEGKRVLEVGGSNIPKALLFEVLRVRQWISVDRVYPENRQYWPKQYQHTGVIPIAEDIDYSILDQHVILDGGIEHLPPSFFGRFDAVVSMDAFEHVHRSATMLERTYDALKPGGKMLSMYSPIWSSHIGHHLWGVTDKAGRTYFIEASPIPKWGHLLMRPHEMYRYLLGHTDPETADEIVYRVYHSELLNRLFYEDFEANLEASRFESVELKKYIPDVDPDPETQRRLETLHPGRRNFSTVGILAICEKTGQRAG